MQFTIAQTLFVFGNDTLLKMLEDARRMDDSIVATEVMFVIHEEWRKRQKEGRA